MSSEARQVAPVHLVFEDEMIFDAPVETVWRHLIDYPSWQNFTIVQPVSGKPGEEGEVVRLQKEEAGVRLSPYYARTLKRDPPRRIIWKTYRDTPDYFGIVDFKLEVQGGKTRFCRTNVYEFLVPYRDERELEAFREERTRMSRAVFAVTFPKLKKLVEERGARSS